MGTDDDGLGAKFMATDKAIYGTIPNITDKTKYTNSFELPESDKVKMETKIKIEGPYHELTNGGHLLKINQDNINTEKLDKIIKTAKQNNIGFIKL